MNLRFLLREIVQSRKQAMIFVLCVLVAVTTLIALQSFRRDVNRLVHGDAQALHGGDVLVESHYEIGEKLLRGIAEELAEISTVEAAPRAEGRNMSMVLAPVKKKSETKSDQRRRREAAAAQVNTEENAE